MENTKIKNLWMKIPMALKAAFIACFVSGYITHLFAFTNIIPNSDGLSRVYDTQQMTVSGRWFLHYASLFNKFVQAPALIGFFSVLFMSAAAVLVVAALDIDRPLPAAIAGVVMIVFPSAAYTYLYMFTASAYFFGIFLAAAGFFAAKKYKFGFIPGAFLLAAAVGTYQAYLAFAATLCAVSLLRTSVRGEENARQLIFRSLRYIGFAGGGTIIYYVILQIFLAVKKLSLLSYLGMSTSLSKYPILELPSIIGKAYGGFFKYYFQIGTGASYTTGFAVLLNILILVVSAVLLVSAIIQNGTYKKPASLIFGALALLVFPVAVNFNVLLNPAGEATPVMRYSFVLFYLLPLIFTYGKTASIQKLFRALLCCLIAASSLFFVQIDNIAYTASAQAHRATESFVTRLAERVESTEGYYSGMEVVIIGSYPENTYSNDIEIFSLVEHYSCKSTTVTVLNKHMYYYLNDWLNIPWQEPSEETMISVADSQQFKNMPLYPSDGSVAVYQGRIIVKLSDTYTPKSDYEIQYENRR